MPNFFVYFWSPSSHCSQEFWPKSNFDFIFETNIFIFKDAKLMFENNNFDYRKNVINTRPLFVPALK